MMTASIVLTGRLGGTPETKTSKNGQQEYLVGTILAKTDDLSDKGEWVTRGSQWFDWVVFAPSLIKLIKELSEESGNILLTLSGTLEFIDWKKGDRSGTTLNIVVQDVLIPGRGQKVHVEPTSTHASVK